MNSSWQRIGAFILRQRIPLLVLLGVITVFMWNVRGTEMVHEISKVMMSNKEEMEAYTRFRSTFGDDGKAGGAEVLV
jgi:predicted RND superfamily exporter protein